MRALLLSLLLPILGMFVPILGTSAQAAPIYQATAEGVKITLTDEPCALAAVKNMPRRATWTEGGAVVEGCWGISPLRLVLFYFADLTVAAVPQQMFTPVSGT